MIQTEEQQRTTKSPLLHCSKWSAILLLLVLSFVLVACDNGNATNTAILGDPQVLVSIRFKNNVSSTPTVAPYLCGAWITNAMPSFKPGDEIPVYAHFVHNVDGNPVGVSGASARASVEWADGSSSSEGALTPGGGLAIFYFMIPNRPDIVNRNNLVMVSFTGRNGETCNIDNQPQPAAFFTLVKGPSASVASPPLTSVASPSALPRKRHRKS